MTAEQLSMIVFIGDHSVRFWLGKCDVAFFLKCTDDDLVSGQITIFLNFYHDTQSVSLSYLLTMLDEMEYYNFFNILLDRRLQACEFGYDERPSALGFSWETAICSLQFRVCSFTLPGFQIFARRSLFNAAMFFFCCQVKVHHFYSPKHRDNSLIQVQKSNKHIADG